MQNILISLYGWLLKRRRYNKVYKKRLNGLIEQDHADGTKELEYQNKEFLELLHYAVEHSAFYKEFYQGVDLSKIKTVDDIAMLPMLTKDILKSNINKIYTIRGGTAYKSYTGGTTGTPMMVLFRWEDYEKRLAYLDAYKYRYGFINNKMKSAHFFGKNIIPPGQKKKIYWRDNLPSKQRFYSTYYLTEDNIPYYIENLNRFKPCAIDGFVSSIYEIAKYIINYNSKLSFKPLAVFTTAETVLPFQREMIEKAFNCPLSDQYASSEGAPFITQCRCGSYHENIDTGVFEHIDDGNGGKKLVVTSFDSFGTPLIRYDIGDRVVESKTKFCDCGCVHPIIERIDGRGSDYLICGGRRIGLVQLSTMISELPAGIKLIQFCQNIKDDITVKIVLSNDRSMKAVKAAVTHTTERFLGNDSKITVEFVNDIPREKSGKFRMIQRPPGG